MKLSLYIAQSLDGYIAAHGHGLEWLESVALEGEDYGYGEYYDSVDALLMGGNTFDVIRDFSPWPYAGKISYVASRRQGDSAEQVSFISGNVEQMYKQLQQAGHKHVWLVGGGELLAAFLDMKLVDKMIISILPLTLGQGIPLFPSRESRLDHYQLIGHQAFASGLVQLHYRSLAIK